MATYTSAASGLWSAGSTWVGGVKPPSGAGHKIVIAAGHTVTYDEAAGEYGDDTSSLTEANNAIVVNGTLRVSRDVSTQLTCRGTLMVATNGTFDWGRSTDRVPSGVSSVVVLNYSLSMAAGKHGLISRNAQTGQSWFIRGAVRTRNTTLAAPIAAGESDIVVDDAGGWAVGDTLVFASGTDDAADVQVNTLAAGGGLTWTLAAPMVLPRAAGSRVGNLTSNVTLRAYSAAFSAVVALACSVSGSFGAFDVGDFAAENISGSNGWAGLSSQPLYSGLGLAPGNTQYSCVLERVAAFTTATMAGNSSGFSVDALSAFPAVLKDCAVFRQFSSGAGLYFGNNCVARSEGTIVYRSSFGVLSSFGSGAAYSEIEGGYIMGGTYGLSYASGKLLARNLELRGTNALIQTSVSPEIHLENCALSAPRVFSYAINSFGEFGISRCSLSEGLLAGSNTVSATPNRTTVAVLDTVNGDVDDNRVLGHWISAVTDASVRKRSTYSARITPNVANTPIVYTFSLPAVAGQQQTIKGSLRFDGTYGTATPPVIALSGQGVSASFTATATADAWHDFTLTFTPTTTGDIAATVTVQSASTAGFVWLDGVWHYPMTQSVRHYGYEWAPRARQVADPRITLTESAALALPVAVDHTALTITVTGAVTAREVFEACMADLVQTANQTRAVHISSATGDTFDTTFTVVTNNAGAITGVYTDAAGVHVTVAAPALVPGSRVQLFNVTDAAEVFNGVLTATGLLLPVTWTANKTIRLRVEHPDKLPLQTLGVLTSTGLSFLDVQADDTVYMGNGIDGSTCTEFSADGPNIQVDINDPDGITSVQRLYAWMQWYQTTAAGIASSFFGAMAAIDSATYVVDQAAADIRLDNVSALPVRVVGGYLARRDGSTIIAAASNSIQMDPGKAYVAPLNALSIPAGERLVTMQPSGAVLARG